MDLNIENKHAVVTGAAGGLGAAIAKSLAAEGANVTIIDINEPSYTLPTKQEFYKLDLSDLNAVEKAIADCGAKLGPVDILINCAGIWPTDFVKDMPTASWVRTMDINMTAVFVLCREFINACLANDREGVILNVTSQAAFGGSTSGHAHYAAAKAAMVNFTRSLAREIGKHKIRVNALAPGMMETQMASAALADRRETYIERIPIGRIAAPSEVADVAIFLVSSKAGYMTGATIDVSGGMLMH